jgi:hypothetical protein
MIVNEHLLLERSDLVVVRVPNMIAFQGVLAEAGRLCSHLLFLEALHLPNNYTESKPYIYAPLSFPQRKRRWSSGQDAASMCLAITSSWSCSSTC